MTPPHSLLPIVSVFMMPHLLRTGSCDKQGPCQNLNIPSLCRSYSPAAGGFLWKFSVPKMFMLIWVVYPYLDKATKFFWDLRPCPYSGMWDILGTENLHRTSPAEGLISSTVQFRDSLTLYIAESMGNVTTLYLNWRKLCPFDNNIYCIGSLYKQLTPWYQ